MTMAGEKAFFDPANRSRLLPLDSRSRRRWPGLAALIDRSSDRVLRNFEGLLPDRQCIERQYAAYVGEPLDLDNPRLLSEKVQWLKLNDATPLHTICCDKIRARDFVRERVGEQYLIPALLISSSSDDLVPAKVTAERFAAKTNHDWGGVVLCHDRDSFNWAAARAKLERHLRAPFWRTYRERAYKDIEPGIIVEQFLEGADNGPPDDFKLFCFHGRPELIQVVGGRSHAPTWTMYDLAWNKLPIQRRGRPSSTSPHPKPASLDTMINVATALSEPFRFCRVDLYNVDGRVYFGEIAFYPEAGYRPFEPREIEVELGDMLRLD